jgi:Aldo/keto reductase family
MQFSREIVSATEYQVLVIAGFLLREFAKEIFAEICCFPRKARLLGNFRQKLVSCWARDSAEGVIMIGTSDFRNARIPLNNGSGHMPALDLGTLIPDAAMIISATRDALEAGSRHFDCAERYRNEREVGEALQAGLAADGTAREDTSVTTKLSNSLLLRLKLKRQTLADYPEKRGSVHCPVGDFPLDGRKVACSSIWFPTRAQLRRPG